MLAWTGGTRARVVGLLEWVCIIAAAFLAVRVVHSIDQIVDFAEAARQWGFRP